MRAYVGVSQSNQPEQAIAEATKGLKTADLLIMFTPYKTAGELAQLLAAKYPGVPMLGTAGSSVAKGSISDRQVVIIGFAGVTVSHGLISQVNTAPAADIQSFQNAIEAIEADPANTICLEFVTGYEEKVLSTMNATLRQHGLSMMGATCHGVPLGEKHLVIYNGKVYNRSLVFAFVKNNAGKIHIIKENIYKRLSKRSHLATLVEPGTKTLFQLDGRPALEVYQEETGLEAEFLVANASRNPLGRALGADTSIIQTMSVDRNGVLFNGKAIYENDGIYVMELDDYRAIHENTCEEIASCGKKVSFLLCFDSINRLKLFTEEEYIQEYLSSLSAFGTQASLLTDSQQYNGQQMNQTLVCAVFE